MKRLFFVAACLPIVAALTAVPAGAKPETGTVHGRITDAGAAAKDAQVYITNVDQHWSTTVRTGADGTYSFTGLAPDKYRLSVSYGDRSQWVHQKSSFFDADTFDVASSTTVVVDEAMLPYGAVKFVAVDETSGAPVRDACAWIHGGGKDERGCTSGDGTVLIKNLPANGYYGASVWDAAGTHYTVSDLRPSVVEGKTVELRVALRPAAAFRTTVVDSRTQAPLTGVCVEPHTVPVEGIVDRDYSWYCTDDSGTLIIGPLNPDTYQFFVKPNDKNFGMQWVGARGGTGDIRQAHKGIGRLRETTVLPRIAVDPAGVITGTVKDNAGAVLPSVCVFPFAADPRNGFRFLENCTNSNGQYRIKGLGPYAWPLEFLHNTGKYATQWSGGAADRFGATPVTVWAGGTTVSDASLVPAGRITGRTLDRNGKPAFGYVYAFSARTGDIITWGTSDNDENFEVDGLGTQDVRIKYVINDKACWYPKPISVVAGEVVKGIDLVEC
ncbi:carboxypeptidase regulatory-like domain-containing protein [Allokutzneria sp. A3M-2-11 16]|uniref:carboxypeptidase regulatory-like domain-containing protein n=1 Tax=Allokutzneria sp. A3M-2-11 16 TaxID=2962043 RepID=UPI0020B8A29B|nr:carboxypeptidase regulatory-like domain-containing protein [Allokutzneria sp. A3M-2-11 16]MCP3803764.1 carboxypeptidase regulatory-like domain-containing protein [Allokutzneria sp. A3M-2-11 16]